MVAEHSETMQCMEVWGGNEPADRGVRMAGLDAAVFASPFNAAGSGGDVHYLSSCATGRITRILLADVSGHGESVANTARQLRDLMRRFINFVDQTRLVRGLNRAFTSDERGGTFATAIVATYWAPTGSLVICNAGHPRPLLYRARRREWSVLAHEEAPGADDQTGIFDIPLGIDADGGYSQFGLRLARGDFVVMYTDSLVEARAGDGPMLGELGLLELVRSIPPTSPSELVKQLLDRVDAYRGGVPAGDDTTVLALTPNDAVPRASLWQGVLATSRIARASIQSLLGGSSALPLPQLRSDVIGGAVVDRMNRPGERTSGR